MSNYENIKWFNCPIFRYVDDVHGTNNSLDITHSFNTEDYQSFSPLTFDLRITTPSRASGFCKINYPQILDFLQSLRKITVPDYVYGEAIVKRFNKKDLSVRFGKIKGSNVFVSLLELMGTGGEVYKIILPVHIYKTLTSLMNEFITNYVSWGSQYRQEMRNIQIVQRVHTIESLLKNLPSYLIEFKQESEGNHSEVTKTPRLDTNDELKNFVGDIDSIPMDEDSKKIESPKKELKVLSPFIEKCLKNDVMTFDAMLKASIVSPNPLQALSEIIENDVGFRVLPGVTEDEWKSFSYISKLNFMLSYKNYLEHSAPLPRSGMILYYTPDPLVKDLKENKELAYELLAILAYYKCARTKLENKTGDAIKNCGVSYFAMRNFLDPLVFSFVGKGDDENFLTGAILNKYRAMEQGGFFSGLIRHLKEHQCAPVSEAEISTFCRDLISKVIKVDLPRVGHSHNACYKSSQITLPFKNDLSLEQIIKTVIPLEMVRIAGGEIKETKEYKSLEGSEREVIDSLFFSKKKRIVETPQESEQSSRTNIARYLDTHLELVPENYHEWLDVVKDRLSTHEFDPKWIPQIEDFISFDVLILRAFLLWNPKKKMPYSKWTEMIETSALTKDNVLTSWRRDLDRERYAKPEPVSADEWWSSL